jgi:hypothetical protein
VGDSEESLTPDPLPPSPPEGGPPAPPGTGEELFFQAEGFRHRQVWEEAIRLYRFSLQKSPDKLETRFGLGLSYEGKSREPGYESYLQAAMAEYRKIIGMDPRWIRAHDALLAASAKADALDDMLSEYHGLIAAGKDVQAFKDTLKKVQALLLLKTAPAEKIVPPPPIMSFLFGLAAPGIGILALLAAFIVRLKGGGEGNPLLIFRILMKISMGGFFSFLGYKVYLYWRSLR